MRKWKSLVLWSVGTVVSAGLVTVAIVHMRPIAAPNSAADRLVGSWDGQGGEPTQAQIAVGEKQQAVPLTLRSTATATFHKNGTLNYSFLAEAEGFRFSLAVPDPNKPGDIGRWDVLRSDGDGLVLRLIGPGGPEYAVSFRGADEFAMTPLDPATGSGTMIFRRVTPQK